MCPLTNPFFSMVPIAGDIARIVLTPQAGDVIAIDSIAGQEAPPTAVIPLPAAGPVVSGALALPGLIRRPHTR